MTDVLITAGELAELVKKEPCVIIDTRNPDAYAAGHLPVRSMCMTSSLTSRPRRRRACTR